jgi:hypothetical protein
VALLLLLEGMCAVQAKNLLGDHCSLESEDHQRDQGGNRAEFTPPSAPWVHDGTWMGWGGLGVVRGVWSIGSVAGDPDRHRGRRLPAGGSSASPPCRYRRLAGGWLRLRPRVFCVLGL